ncbi:MAG: fibronectin/fibrinogen-binding protein [Clostridia bacterium]|nr:fibronectin/fibrinogen-binding protein [Clostridia bacterium]
MAAFDGLTMSAVKTEIENNFMNGRVDRIHQPQKETIIISFRTKAKFHRLLVSARADASRIHIIREKMDNPPHPPVFCMVLRKHLEGARLVGIQQKGLERVLTLHFTTINEAGVQEEKLLNCEIMGRHSNIVLVDEASGHVVDGIRRYSHQKNRYREILPGVKYKLPPSQNKANLISLNENNFREQVLSHEVMIRMEKILLKTLQGFSPQACAEVIFRAGLPNHITLDECGEYELNRIWDVLQQIKFMLESKNFKPTLVHHPDLPNGYKAFAPMDQKKYPDERKRHLQTISDALETYYHYREEQGQYNSMKQSLERILSREIRKSRKKIAKQDRELASAEDYERHKIAGELITANIYRLSKGDSILRTENYYSQDGETITITLEPSLTPSQNAQRYFKKYRKGQVSGEKINRQLSINKRELAYLESVSNSVELAESTGELFEIAEELRKGKYLKQSVKKHRTQGMPSFISFSSSDGYQILIGKNNRQNDHITMRLARAGDLWFHTKDIPGAHIVVKKRDEEDFPERTILEAAVLAAHYSKGRFSSNVAVDYTDRKNVRKTKGAKPGMVIYDNHRTLYVTPDKSRLESILKNNSNVTGNP